MARIVDHKSKPYLDRISKCSRAIRSLKFDQNDASNSSQNVLLPVTETNVNYAASTSSIMGQEMNLNRNKSNEHLENYSNTPVYCDGISHNINSSNSNVTLPQSSKPYSNYIDVDAEHKGKNVTNLLHKMHLCNIDNSKFKLTKNQFGTKYNLVNSNL